MKAAEQEERDESRTRVDYNDSILKLELIVYRILLHLDIRSTRKVL
jgi:hypothetical protein